LESLAYLFLGNNYFEHVSASWFEGGWGSNLLRLGLTRNNINSIEAGAFDTLESLEFCTLDYNNLMTIPDGLFANNDNLIGYTLGSPVGGGPQDAEGTYAVSVVCAQSEGQMIGPVELLQTVMVREDGAVNIVGGGNHTLNSLGNRLFTGATTWLPSYPGLFYSTYPPEHLPPVHQVEVQFNEDYSGYYITILQQQPGRATLCHGYGTEGYEPVDVFDYFPSVDGFLDTYEAEVICMYGEDVESWTETQTLMATGASDAAIYALHRSMDGWASHSIVANDGNDPYVFKGLTTNITGYNHASDDPAWYDGTLGPVQNINLYFDDDWQGYDAIFVGAMPGPASVCKMSATRTGRRRKAVEERKPQRKLDGHLGGTTCSPTTEIGGYYFTDLTCSRFSDSFDFQQDSRVRDLGGEAVGGFPPSVPDPRKQGFYKITSQHHQLGVWDDVLSQESIIVEDPHMPGRYYGGVFARNDYVYKVWNVTDYPLLMFVTATFRGEDGETCTGFDSIFQSFRGPAQSPRPLDTVMSCAADSNFKGLVAVINEGSCDENFENCVGLCYDGPYEYMEPCVAGFGAFNAPSFPRVALLPNPMLVERSCLSMGFTETQLFEACPDPFYSRSNGVCVKNTPGFDTFQFFPDIQAGSPFLATGLWPDWQDWGIMWMGDNPQCDYHPPGEPDYATNCNPVAGRYQCTTATCFSGNEMQLDGTPGDAVSVDANEVPTITTMTQEVYIVDNGPREYSLQYFDMVILDHPTNMWLWNATVKQLQTDETKLLGNVYWNTITGEGVVEEDIEVNFEPTQGCGFEMVWQGTAGAFGSWPNNVHNCNWRCERLRN
jgi:hypothetical protein